MAASQTTREVATQTDSYKLSWKRVSYAVQNILYWYIARAAAQASHLFEDNFARSKPSIWRHLSGSWLGACLLRLGSLFGKALLTVPGFPCNLVAACATETDLLAPSKHQRWSMTPLSAREPKHERGSLHSRTAQKTIGASVPRGNR